MVTDPKRTALEVLWVTLATVVLGLRLVSTVATVGFTLVWAVAAVRDSLINMWLWWALGAALALLVSTYLYSILRVRYPSNHDRWDP